MKKIDKPGAKPPTATPVEHQEQWLSKDGLVAVPRHYDKSTLQPDPAETAQEAVHQVMPKADVPDPKPATPPPSSAAKGDDDLMSKCKPEATPSAQEVKEAGRRATLTDSNAVRPPCTP